MSDTDTKGKKSNDRQTRGGEKHTEMSLLCFEFLLLSLRKSLSLDRKIRRDAAKKFKMREKGRNQRMKRQKNI